MDTKEMKKEMIMKRIMATNILFMRFGSRLLCDKLIIQLRKAKKRYVEAEKAFNENGPMESFHELMESL